MAFNEPQPDTAPEGGACIATADNAPQNRSKPELSSERNLIPAEQESPRFVVLDELFTASGGNKHCTHLFRVAELWEA